MGVFIISISFWIPNDTRRLAADGSDGSDNGGEGDGGAGGIITTSGTTTNVSGHTNKVSFNHR